MVGSEAEILHDKEFSFDCKGLYYWWIKYRVYPKIMNKVVLTVSQ